MAKSPKSSPKTETPEEEPVSLAEPGQDTEDAAQPPGRGTYAPGENPWLRGLWMLLFAALFQLAQWVLWIATVIQFLWLLFAKEKNTNIAEFGDSLSKWLAHAARFQTGATEDKPFPFKPWGE